MFSVRIACSALLQSVRVDIHLSPPDKSTLSGFVDLDLCIKYVSDHAGTDDILHRIYEHEL